VTCFLSIDYLDSCGDWPARLLYIPTMTSFEWKPDNQYGRHRSPSYAALSYTWGRWRLRQDQGQSHPRLKVQGITWDIPPVDESLFTVAQFEKVLRRCVSQSRLEFVWVDVACIDQNEGSEVGASEIGRQARIFRGAKNVYVWLVGGTEDAWTQPLATIIEGIDKAAAQARPYFDRILEGQPLLSLGFGASPGTHERDFLLSGKESWITDASRNVTSLMSLPWFTSLWTLQEAFLRPDASYLTVDGEVVQDSSGKPQSLEYTLDSCAILHKVCLESADRRKAARIDTMLQERVLIRVIERSGIDALSQRNPMALYTCARSRQTIRPLDRVYGIMQVWGFRLGISEPGADPSQHWLLDELETQLGSYLIQRFPIESQLHVHTQTVGGRQAWRVSEWSTVPALARNMGGLAYAESGELVGKIDMQNTRLGVRKCQGVSYGFFAGRACKFDCLRAAWLSVDNDEAYAQRMRGLSTPQIALDHTVLLNKVTLQMPYSLFDLPRTKQQHEIGERVSGKLCEYGMQAAVWLLGKVTSPFALQTDPPGSHCTAIGLLLVQVWDPAIGPWWKRLGICSWGLTCLSAEGLLMRESCILEGSSGDWQVVEGIFG